MTKLDITSLENALSQLETSLHYYHSELAHNDVGLRAQFRNSAIQCFEFTYELSYSMIRRQLAQIVETSDVLRQMNFADLIRTAADANLIPDVKRFLRYRKRRNITSHPYNENNTENVVAVLDNFVQDIHYLIRELKERNEPKFVD